MAIKKRAEEPAPDAVPKFEMGDRIRKARRHNGNRITQEKIAQAITLAGWPVTKQAVGNWESGANDIDEDKRALVATAVALVTRVSRVWILTGEGGSATGPSGSPVSSPDAPLAQLAEQLTLNQRVSRLPHYADRVYPLRRTA